MNFKVDLPVIRDAFYNIKELGGISGGLVSNTKVINDVIVKAAQEGGGHVIFPAGIWLSGPITLLSGIDLHVEAGAILLFDKNKEEYPLIIADYEGVEHIRTVSPINARNQHDISITGEGVIDGNGHRWRVCKEFKFTKREWDKLIKSSPDTCFDTEEGGVWFPTKSAFEGYKCGEPELDNKESALEEAKPYYDFYRPVMVDLYGCERILIDGVTVENSPAWNLHPIFCKHITIRNAFVKNPDYAQNGDGLDLESCQFVEIANVKFDVGDDAICMKSGKNAKARQIKVPTEDVYIHDCTVLHGHGGFVVGSEMSRGVRRVTVDNCTFLGTDVGIRFKSALGRGGVVEDINIKNINMINIPGEAIIFTMGYALSTFNKSESELKETKDREDIPEFRNINISNVNAVMCGEALKIEGIDVMSIHDISLTDVRISAMKGITVSNADNIKLQNVVISKLSDGTEHEYKEEIIKG